MQIKTERLYGQVTDIYERSGRGTILGQRNGATFFLQFFIIEAPLGLQVGEWVSCVPGMFKAIDIRREEGIMKNVVRVDFKEKRRLTHG
jgi:hypothetical protein